MSGGLIQECTVTVTLSVVSALTLCWQEVSVVTSKWKKYFLKKFFLQKINVL